MRFGVIGASSCGHFRSALIGKYGGKTEKDDKHRYAGRQLVYTLVFDSDTKIS